MEENLSGISAQEFAPTDSSIPQSSRAFMIAVKAGRVGPGYLLELSTAEGHSGPGDSAWALQAERGRMGSLAISGRFRAGAGARSPPYAEFHFWPRWS